MLLLFSGTWTMVMPFPPFVSWAGASVKSETTSSTASPSGTCVGSSTFVSPFAESSIHSSPVSQSSNPGGIVSPTDPPTVGRITYLISKKREAFLTG